MARGVVRSSLLHPASLIIMKNQAPVDIISASVREKNDQRPRRIPLPFLCWPATRNDDDDDRDGDDDYDDDDVDDEEERNATVSIRLPMWNFNEARTSNRLDPAKIRNSTQRREMKSNLQLACHTIIIIIHCYSRKEV